MKSVLVLAAAAALPFSSQAKGPGRESLMDEIERKVRLPFGARPLAEYGRYYFFGEKDRAEGVYFHTFDPASGDLGPAHLSCVEGVMREGKPAVRAIPCPADPAARRYLRAGHRQWVAGRSAVPTVHDGGCVRVSVTFNLKSRMVERIGCNGIA